MGVGRKSNSLALHELSECRTERALVVTHDVEIANAPIDGHDIHVESGNDLRGRHGRVLTEIRGAQEARFLGGDESKELGTARLYSFGGGVRDGQYRRDARSVVDGTIVDRVAVGNRADPEGHPIRGL